MFQTTKLENSLKKIYHNNPTGSNRYIRDQVFSSTLRCTCFFTTFENNTQKKRLALSALPLFCCRGCRGTGEAETLCGDQVCACSILRASHRNFGRCHAMSTCLNSIPPQLSTAVVPAQCLHSAFMSTSGCHRFHSQKAPSTLLLQAPVRPAPLVLLWHCASSAEICEPISCKCNHQVDDRPH
jgi:hypothetical protein